ncbi:autophagy-related protein 13-domain-containing protein [Coniella lustricola]|uniref:Autophagy-related protein 13 n=1 Tax=Coniella lustricola TaxID=2025994 RepID=A0A2T3AM57_9PEZI|nr:autophagy-related protein 13-domain-containing protein [Coniella lustricola]
MHQHPRHHPKVSSPASSPQTNPTRSNNPRDSVGEQVRASLDSPRHEGSGSLGSGELASFGPSRESVKKLDQILQNFFFKAGSIIATSRVNTKRIPDSKPNKWFSLTTDEVEQCRNELQLWKTATTFENPFPPMIVETYLDASHLSTSQCLVLTQQNGKEYNVLESLNSIDASGGSPTFKGQNTEVILERWRFELKPIAIEDIEEFGHTLPTVYKKAVVYFRSLWSTVRLWPAFRFALQSRKEGRPSALEVKCRFLTSEKETSGVDLLRHPLGESGEAVTDYLFGDLEVPAGRLTASVTYRNECNFKLVNAESLLSSRFTAIDEHLFRPTLAQNKGHRRRDTSAEVGSLPSRRRGQELEPEDVQQAYGSMSTFHGAGPLGTSPITALKSVKPMGSGDSSPAGSAAASMDDPPNSLPIRPSMRGKDSVGRRTSITFQPFKAGSLSGSPRIPEGEIPASPIIGSRQSGLSALAQARNRNSLIAGMPASLRGGPPAVDIPASPSARPSGSRISSSFSHRRARSSFGGQSRGGDDDQASSGRQSLSSSIVQPGSGLLADAGGQASSGSLNADDDNISDFLKLLDSKKTLTSFESLQKGEAATKRTVAQLSKFQVMRESNNALTESMASSMQLYRSSSSSSRQLTSVPGMVAPASMSISSSPGKPLSPHTPHTPAIPSRLSENSIIDYDVQAQAARRGTRVAPQISSTEEEQGGEPPVSPEGTTAIDIPLPLSPRLMHSNRRASSVAQQQRNMAEDDDGDGAFGSRRSISLGAERDPPTLSTLLGMEPAGSAEDTTGLQSPARIRASGVTGSSSFAEPDRATPGSLLHGNSSDGTPRLRYKSTRGRPTPPHSSRGSFIGSGSGRHSMGRGDNEADDEPLVFDMQVSEMGRRSLEEGRGGGSVGSSYEQRGVSRRGW